MESATDKVDAQLISLSDQLAAAISNRDADGAARGVREDEHVVYISDGHVIRGREYRDVLRRFYAGVRQIHFQWESREVEPIGRDGRMGGVVTGWAKISIIDSAGAVSNDKALFTLVYSRAANSWEFLAAHKTTIR